MPVKTYVGKIIGIDDSYARLTDTAVRVGEILISAIPVSSEC